MSNKVPDEWVINRFDKIAKFTGGSAFKEVFQGKNQGDYPFIKVSDMNHTENQRIIQRANHWISDKVKKLENIKIFPQNSIVFAKVGAALLLNRRRILSIPTAIDNNMMAAVPIDCDYQFLFYLLQTIDFSEFVQDGAVPSVNQNQLGELKVLTPPLPEQQKIASILTSVDDVIEKTQSQINKLQDLKKATMNDLLTRGIGHTEFKDSVVGRIPKSWDVFEFGNIVNSIKSGLSRRLSSTDIGFPVINSGNVTNDGLLSINEIKYWYKDDPQGANTKHYYLESGDILLNFINSLSQIGKSCVYQNIGRTAIYTTNIFRIRPSEKISSQYLYLQMNCAYFLKEIKLITKPAVNQASFTKQDLEKILITIPTIKEQKEIVEVIDNIDNNLRNKKKSLESLKNLKKSLMQDLLTGKVRVSVN